MNQSKLKGKEIFELISKARTELNELGTACDSVGDELGRGSIAYKILDTNYKEKQKEVYALENEKYVVDTPPDLSVFE